jgi:hypothetical protein
VPTPKGAHPTLRVHIRIRQAEPGVCTLGLAHGKDLTHCVLPANRLVQRTEPQRQFQQAGAAAARFRRGLCVADPSLHQQAGFGTCPVETLLRPPANRRSNPQPGDNGRSSEERAHRNGAECTRPAQILHQQAGSGVNSGRPQRKANQAGGYHERSMTASSLRRSLRPASWQKRRLPKTDLGSQQAGKRVLPR